MSSAPAEGAHSSFAPTVISVITGFNTDIEYNGVIYHVQTEDKGRSKPIILSLVYDRGTILASKRTAYDDLLKGNFSERILAERLSKQHRLICAAIQAGRLEDLKKLAAREAAGAKQHSDLEKQHSSTGQVKESPKTTADAREETQAEGDTAIAPPSDPLPESRPSKPSSVSLADFQGGDAPIPKPSVAADNPPDDSGFIDEPIVEAVAIIDLDEIILPDEAVAIIDEPQFVERPNHNKLCIEIIGDAKFRGGERSTVGFLVSRGTGRKVVPGAEIMVKILGSSFRPVIFHAHTDGNGVATVNVQVPSFSSGRAAFLVRAMSEGEEIELRRSIAHG